MYNLPSQESVAMDNSPLIDDVPSLIYGISMDVQLAMFDYRGL